MSLAHRRGMEQVTLFTVFVWLYCVLIRMPRTRRFPLCWLLQPDRGGQGLGGFLVALPHPLVKALKARRSWNFRSHLIHETRELRRARPNKKSSSSAPFPNPPPPLFAHTHHGLPYNTSLPIRNTSQENASPFVHRNPFRHHLDDARPRIGRRLVVAASPDLHPRFHQPHARTRRIDHLRAPTAAHVDLRPPSWRPHQAPQPPCRMPSRPAPPSVPRASPSSPTPPPRTRTRAWPRRARNPKRRAPAPVRASGLAAARRAAPPAATRIRTRTARR
jgi:hypothetical protein